MVKLRETSRESGGSRAQSPTKQQVELFNPRLDRENFRDMHHAMKEQGEEELWEVPDMTDFEVVRASKTS